MQILHRQNNRIKIAFLFYLDQDTKQQYWQRQTSSRIQSSNVMLLTEQYPELERIPFYQECMLAATVSIFLPYHYKFGLFGRLLYVAVQNFRFLVLMRCSKHRKTFAAYLIFRNCNNVDYKHKVLRERQKSLLLTKNIFKR